MISRRRCAVIAMVAIAMIAAATQATSQSRDERWISTWTTAQQLAPMSFPAGFARSRPSPAQGPAQRPGNSPEAFDMPSRVEDQTIRMIARIGKGGRQIRVNLSNAYGAEPVLIGSARVAFHGKGGAILPGTDRALSFGGRSSFALIPGALMVSDPVDLEAPAFTDLAVSLYLPRNAGSPTHHRLGLRTTYISKGDATARERMPNAAHTFAYFWLAGIDVLAPADAFTIVALGDSITDGYATSVDGNRAWPTLLTERLNSSASGSNISVVNQGISGNQVLRDGAGLSALARFDRDVLSVAGVKWLILLEGINDINLRGRTDGPDALTGDELIAGYRQIIERAHRHGIRVVGATLTPEEGVPTMSARGEQIRQTVNQWIRTSGRFDAVVDFDAVIRDPARPVRMRPEFDPGDHIHPNDDGNKAMADAFDLTIFRN